MADAAYLQTSFLGGEVSQTRQGRADLPEYATSMNLCLNGLPMETGAWTRRPGTAFLAHTKGGVAGRVLAFDFKQSSPYILEFTNGNLRFHTGTRPATTNDQQAVVSISAANPAKVLTGTHGWSSGNTVMFNSLGTNNVLLQGRQFLITKTSSTEFTLADAITGASIDGSTLGAFVSGNVTRIQDIVTTYGAGSWGSVRSVQAETSAVLLNGAHPQVVAVTTPPSPVTDAQFSLTPSNFLDGPYLDPYPGSQCTYDAVSGNITLTFAFQTYSSTTSYNVGDFVTSSGQGYKSLTAANAGNTPASSPTNWLAVNGGAPVGPNGFLGADVGRHIRLFSEPAGWASGTTYAKSDVVKYNGAYYQSLAGTNTGNIPGTDATKWTVVTGANYAQWTWGRVLSVSGAGLISPSVAIGNIGSLSGCFDGTTVKNFAGSSTLSGTVTTYQLFDDSRSYSTGNLVYYAGGLYSCIRGYFTWSPSTWTQQSIVSYGGFYYEALSQVPADHAAVAPDSYPAVWQNIGGAQATNATIWAFLGLALNVTVDAYAGQDFHTSAKAISSATIFPSTDFGYGKNVLGVTLNLRAKHTLPSSASDGSVIGSLGTGTTAAVTLVSTDSTTLWEYVWVEVLAARSPYLPDDGSDTFTLAVSLAQVQFFSPNIANGSVIGLQLAGPALLYAPGAVVTTWRAGAYSDTNGWPTNGTYHEGRLWLSGAIDNRADASKSNDIYNFAPTGPAGAVADDNAISATFNASDVNAIYWMVSDERGIICGSQGGEWLIRATDLNNPITPTNIQAHRATRNGCANVEPRHTGLTLAFVRRFQHSVMEYFSDVFSGRFAAPDLTSAFKHLSTRGVAELAYQSELFPVLWMRCLDGSLIGATYKRESLMSSQGPNFAAGHQHVLGSLRLIESLCVGPAGASFDTAAGDLETAFMVTNDPATGIRHIEYMTNLFEEEAPLRAAWHVDGGIVPTVTQNVVLGGVSSFQMSGLWPHNGKTLTVWAGGLDCGDYLVTNGSLNVPFGAANGLFTAAFVAAFNGTMPVVAGFTYTSRGQLLRAISPPASGARNGPALGKKRRVHQFAALLVNALGLSFGTAFGRLNAASLRTPGEKAWPVTTAYTGVHWDTVKGDSTFDEMLCWEITRPYPATIAAIEGFVQTQDR